MIPLPRRAGNLVAASARARCASACTAGSSGTAVRRLAMRMRPTRPRRLGNSEWLTLGSPQTFLVRVYGTYLTPRVLPSSLAAADISLAIDSPVIARATDQCELNQTTTRMAAVRRYRTDLAMFIATSGQTAHAASSSVPTMPPRRARISGPSAASRRSGYACNYSSCHRSHTHTDQSAASCPC